MPIATTAGIDLTHWITYVTLIGLMTFLALVVLTVKFFEYLNRTKRSVVTSLIIVGAVVLYVVWGGLMRQTCALMVATDHSTQASCLFALPPASSHMLGQAIGIGFLAVEATGLAWLIRRWRFNRTDVSER